MRLIASEHGESIRRFAHLRRARSIGARSCAVRLAGTRHSCTREEFHRGPHVAHGAFRKVVAVWDTGGGPATKIGSVRESKARQRPTRRPVGLRTSPTGGAVSRGARRILRMIMDIEELALLLMFVAFVYFGVGWLKIILQ